MKVKVVSALLSLSLLAGFTAVLFAQDENEENANVVMEYRFTTKPLHQPQFEAAVKEHRAWLTGENGTMPWFTFQVIVSDKYYGDYVIRTGPSTWAEHDQYAEFFNKQVIHFQRQTLPLIVKTASTLNTVDYKNSTMDYSEVKPLYEVFLYQIRPAKIYDFTDTLGKIHSAVVEKQWPLQFAWEFVNSGTVGITAYMIIPRASWADFVDPEPGLMAILNEVYGEEEAGEIFNKFFDAVIGYESVVLRFRPDLSYIPEQ